MFDWDFRDIGIEDRPIFDEALKRENPATSELTFTNLFVWRHSKPMRFAKYREGLVLQAETAAGPVFYPPIGYARLPEIYSDIADSAIRKGLSPLFTRIPESHAELLRASGLSSGMTIEEDRDNFDYVYTTESLAYLKGWRLDGKRGFVRKFVSNYSFHYLKYCKCMKEKCLKMTKVWMHNKTGAGADLEIPKAILDEYDALVELLDNYEAFDCPGAVLCVDGTPAAFSFGERLNDSTFVVHFEKANTQLVGSFQTINQMFVQNEVQGKWQYVNREQDLGLSGLRKAKESYVPVRMEKKYNVSIR